MTASSPAHLQVLCLCAQWCGTCRDYRPLLAGLALANPDAHFAWVDVEDHADLADAFDVETFPTLLVASEQGQHFLGPMLPHIQALARLLTALPAASPLSPDVAALLQAVRTNPVLFSVGEAG